MYDEYGNDITVTDGRWIINLGTNGLLGMTADFAILLAPLSLLLLRYPPRPLVSSAVAPQLALAVAATLYAIDCLLNNMPTPIYLVAVGGVVGCEYSHREGMNTDAAASSNKYQTQVMSVVLRRLDER